VSVASKRLHRERLKAAGICVDCGQNPKEGAASVLCEVCKADRRTRVKLSSVYGKKVKKYRRLDPESKHLNFMVGNEAHSKLHAMVGDANRSWFIEQLIFREYARREKRAQRDEGVCTNPCAGLSEMSHSA
jgi:hypothetical protein